MCLLITGTSKSIRATLLNTSGLIEDIFKSNPDGLGAMYVNKHGLKIAKVLPASALAAKNFIQQLPDDDRELALHWRWKTHGDIDLTNCHPYTIEEGVSAMMHNGVLHTGNRDDKTKSDTWHFVKNYLATCTPDTMHDSTFSYLLGDYIGDNRFAIMSKDGRLTVVNKDQGIEHEGVWFSNVYAWSPELLIADYWGTSRRSVYAGASAWGDSAGEWMDDDDDDVTILGDVRREKASDTQAGKKEGRIPGEGRGAYESICDSIEDSLADYDVSTLAECLVDYPALTLAYINRTYKLSVYSLVVPERDLSTIEQDVLTALLESNAGNSGPLITFMENKKPGTFHRPRKVAEVLMYYTVWHPRSDVVAQAPAAPAAPGVEQDPAQLPSALPVTV